MLFSRLRLRAFTLVELLVIIGVSALVASFILALLVRAKERSGRVPCQSNLKQIGTALILYSHDFKGAFPRIRADESGITNQFTGSLAPHPFNSSDAPAVNDVTAAMFLLIRYADLHAEIFVCPHSAAKEWDLAGKRLDQVSNFPSDKYLSYSIANPYPSSQAVARGYKWDGTIQADFAIAADINPGGHALLKLTATSPQSQHREGNSRNHAQEGQNVLYADGHVEWSTTSFAGANKDNIYAAAATRESPDGLAQLDPAANVAGTDPQLALDSIMLPAGSLPAAPDGLFGRRIDGRLSQVAAGIFAVVAIALALARWLWRRATRVHK